MVRASRLQLLGPYAKRCSRNKNVRASPRRGERAVARRLEGTRPVTQWPNDCVPSLEYKDGLQGANSCTRCRLKASSQRFNAASSTNNLPCTRDWRSRLRFRLNIFEDNLMLVPLEHGNNYEDVKDERKVSRQSAPV